MVIEAFFHLIVGWEGVWRGERGFRKKKKLQLESANSNQVKSLYCIYNNMFIALCF